MIGKVCVDSNVLIYTKDLRNPVKSKRCEMWLNHLQSLGIMVLSPQAINELFSTLLRLKVPLPIAIKMAQNYLKFVTHPIDQAVVRRALYIFERYKTSRWDALMMSWAAQAGCSFMLSEDNQSAPVIEGVSIVSPFAFEPSDLS